MSHSKKGSFKTSGFIDHESKKKIERTEKGAPMGKRGSGSNGTDAAHILSWGLTNTIVTHSGGRPRGEESRKEVARSLNSESNLRLKSSYGNKTLDERRDARIAKAYVEGSAIKGNTTSARAVQAYNSARDLGCPLESVANALGNMRIYDADTNRTHALKNHEKHLKRHA